jgi:hypothetical protein
MTNATATVVGFVVGFVVANHLKASFTKIQTNVETGEVITIEEFDSLWDASTTALREWLEGMGDEA